ncbi:DUF819 domain-containing protein [Aestuariibacter sp. A3R04]|uniref:DUF819 family protein n=1 Tax=Aestuariibacter sp. A3R04 TaxID=2841571 RepID=UPI001C095CEB|nr:DUF819 family protein [Aestuariibacter sp. A3R04]MBU3021673.1 DUF819 family protein [Aestuariibacter sp. A3R04]
MITTAFAYISLLLIVAGTLRLLEAKTQWRIFTYLPAIVALYFLVMVLSSIGVWQNTDAINTTYSAVKSNVLPAMIFLMLLTADLRQIRKLGGKLLLAFLAASVSIGIAFTVAFTLFQSWLLPDAWKTLAALSGSWMGGTGNMVAVQLALDVSDASMGYTLLIDSIDYSLWVMLLLALVPYASRFNQWTGADAGLLEKVGAELEKQAKQTSSLDETSSMLFLLALSFVVSTLCQTLAATLPSGAFFTATAWTVTLVTILGVAAALTPIKRLYGASELSTIMLYLIVALIASRANFAELTAAPVYIITGFVILLIHGLLMLVIAKISKLDLFTCGIASLANIGGVASAPILAAAYSRALIPVGVLMALLGYIVGTGGGLLVGKILSVIAV